MRILTTLRREIAEFTEIMQPSVNNMNQSEWFVNCGRIHASATGVYDGIFSEEVDQGDRENLSINDIMYIPSERDHPSKICIHFY